MDDLIREIIKAFEAAQGEYEKYDRIGFLYWLSRNRNERVSIPGKILAAHLTPVLEKHIKPDRIEEIKRLLRLYREKCGPSTNPRMWLDLNGDGKIECGYGLDVAIFGKSETEKTPEDALHSILEPEDVSLPTSATITMSGLTLPSLDGCTLECDGKRYAVTVKKD